jgi:hypothetical protein
MGGETDGSAIVVVVSMTRVVADGSAGGSDAGIGTYPGATEAWTGRATAMATVEAKPPSIKRRSGRHVRGEIALRSWGIRASEASKYKSVDPRSQ